MLASTQLNYIILDFQESDQADVTSLSKSSYVLSFGELGDFDTFTTV